MTVVASDSLLVFDEDVAIPKTVKKKRAPLEAPTKIFQAAMTEKVKKRRATDVATFIEEAKKRPADTLNESPAIDSGVARTQRCVMFQMYALFHFLSLLGAHAKE